MTTELYAPLERKSGTAGLDVAEDQETLSTDHREVVLNGHGNVFDDLFQHLIRLLGLLQRGGIKPVYDDAVGEDWNDQGLEVIGRAEGASDRKSVV